MTEYFVGVDLGGTTISSAAADRNGHILCENQVATNAHEGPQAVLARIAKVLEEFVSRTGEGPAAIGMGCPGLVDVAQGIVRFLPNLPTQWRDVPAASVLAEQFSCPVRLLNDVRTATLGELRYGHGRSIGTMAFFSLGTGVGGGVAIDGRLRLGPLGAAGELGHQTIVPNGLLCGCGNYGCLETVASGPAMVSEGVRLMQIGLAPRLHRRVDGDAGRITPKEMAAAAGDGDDAVRDAIIRAADYLGIGVANVVTILHPDLVVLGGGVAEMGEILLERVRAVVRERVGMFPTDGIRIERSQLGGKAGLLGAVALAAYGVDDKS
jgi:glucokinase